MRSPVSCTARQLQAFSNCRFRARCAFLFCGHSFHSFDVLRHTCDIPACVRLISPASRARRFAALAALFSPISFITTCVPTGRLAMRFKIASSSARSARSFSP